MKSGTDSKRSPWVWIPTLYIAEGLPYFAVNVLTVLMYVNMGVGVAKMAFFTGWLYLPWVIKPFWSPFIDLFHTKRGWTIAMQFLIAAMMAAAAFFLTTEFFFGATLACFWLMAFFSATHDVAADGYYMLALSSHQQAAFVGVRSTFYRIASVIGQGGLVMLAGWLETTTGDIAKAWSTVFAVMSVFFLVIALAHTRLMPPSPSDHARADVTASSLLRDFLSTFSTFFAKPHVWTAISFMLLYRLPEALCIKMVQPFLVSPRDAGGLALTTSEVGLVNGTIGVIALLAGGVAGGLAIAKGGLKKWLWPMALSLTLPCVFYCALAMYRPENFTVIASAIAIEQFGYGFGFSAFMLYLIYFSRGEFQTSHYAFCTAFMALGMMIPGMFAGWLHDILATYNIFSAGGEQGYVNFFWLVMASCAATFVVCSKIRINPSFGRNNPGKNES